LLRRIQFEKIQSSPLENGSTNDNRNRHLILTRFLGHNFETPGASSWHLHLDSVCECWICDKQIYSFIFWSKSKGRAEQITIKPEEKKQIIQRIL